MLGVTAMIIFFIPALLATPLVRDGKIIGGTNASLGAYPYQVGIVHKSGVVICGGSLISELFVLTAAHCEIENKTDYTVVAGSISYANADGIGQVREISKVLPNQNYVDAESGYDVALLKVSQPFAFNSNVQAIKLAKTVPAEATSVIATGWGHTIDGDENSNPSILQTVTVAIVSKSVCEINYGPITKGTVCAAAPGKDTCQGDSGGPLVRKVNNEFIQIGITSYGAGCALAGYPGIYTSVAYYLPWINDKLPN